jgi:signal transduction histidine kinase
MAATGRSGVRPTVRLRLTVLYGGMFCVCGAVLLGITYLLVRHFSGHVLQVSRHGPLESVRSAGRSNTRLPVLPSLAHLQSEAQRDLDAQHSRDLHALLVWSAAALVSMGLVSVVIGWLVAGRVLVPLRTMTATARRISQDNLHERLGVEGPDDELRELGDTIDELLARLEVAFDAQRRFVANASHELRTPLARIRTALDVAVGKPQPPPEVTALDTKIREALDRADRLMDGLLELGRAEHGELSDRDLVALDELVVDVISEHQADLTARLITVERDLDPVLVLGSPTLIGRMVANLIDNGVRHNHPNGRLKVTLSPAEGKARLTVDSDGEAIDPAKVDELSQPFRRLRTDRTGSAQGAGLGLAIVTAIATAHHGTVTLHARDTGGLRVAIDLPQTTITTRLRCSAPVMSSESQA